MTELVNKYDSITSVGQVLVNHALSLLRKKLPKGESLEQKYIELLDMVNYLPLSITQVAAFIIQGSPQTTIPR